MADEKKVSSAGNHYSERTQYSTYDSTAFKETCERIRTHLDLLSIPRLWGKKCYFPWLRLFAFIASTEWASIRSPSSLGIIIKSTSNIGTTVYCTGREVTDPARDLSATTLRERTRRHVQCETTQLCCKMQCYVHFPPNR